MGTFNVGKKDIFNKLKDTVDNIEGDFSQKELRSALYDLGFYPNTTDELSEGAFEYWEGIIKSNE